MLTHHTDTFASHIHKCARSNFIGTNEAMERLAGFGIHTFS